MDFGNPEPLIGVGGDERILTILELAHLQEGISGVKNYVGWDLQDAFVEEQFAVGEGRTKGILLGVGFREEFHDDGDGFSLQVWGIAAANDPGWNRICLGDVKPIGCFDNGFAVDRCHQAKVGGDQRIGWNQIGLSQGIGKGGGKRWLLNIFHRVIRQNKIVWELFPGHQQFSSWRRCLQNHDCASCQRSHFPSS